MPLFKLTEKKLNKRKRDEESGVAKVKAAMREMGELEDGSDSDESGSEEVSVSEEAGSDEEEDDMMNESVGELSGEEDSDSDDEANDAGEAGSEGGSQGEEDAEMDGMSDTSDFPIAIDEVASQPIYGTSETADDSACVVCPGKVFRNDHMAQAHLDSKPHKRAMLRWDRKLRLAKEAGETLSEDPRVVVQAIVEEMEDLKQNREARQAESKKRKQNPTAKAVEVTKSRAESSSMPAAPSTSAAVPFDAPVKRKNRRQRKDRTDEKAVKLVEAAKSQQKDPESGEVKLNRKARRLAEQQAKKAGQEEGATPNSETPPTPAIANGMNGDEEIKTKKPKRRMRKSQGEVVA